MNQKSSKLLILICAWTLFSSLHAEPVWIDTDPACGISRTTDVDDCWALQLALQSPELEIRGISTVFGNSNGNSTYQKALEVVSRIVPGSANIKIHRGSDQKIDRNKSRSTEASRELAQSLEREPLTILALGPLTNIATLLQTHPEMASQVSQIIAVAGKRPQPGLGFYPGKTSVLHLHDFNFRKDVEAFEIVLNSSIPVVLVPYEVASRVIIGSSDLDELSAKDTTRWLARLSEEWLSFWVNDLKAEGFFPFDSLAVAYAIKSEDFLCEFIPAAIERKRSFFLESRDDLIVSNKYVNKRTVKYCYGFKQGLKPTLLRRL
jgi:inosine-uridine nucleoside N-ribohydrolase